ncbi:hypothetical protein ACSBR2_011003 [Camellia fascicularis]
MEIQPLGSKSHRCHLHPQAFRNGLNIRYTPSYLLLQIQRITHCYLQIFALSVTNIHFHIYTLFSIPHQSSLSHLNFPINGKFQRDPRRRNPNLRRTPAPQTNLHNSKPPINGNLLLLKLLQREEHLCTRRITIKVTRKDTIGRKIFQLRFFFFIFHSLFSIILFTSTTKNQNDYKSLCEKWWVPSILSVSVSIVVIFLVQIKLWRYWKVERELQRERSDGRAVTRWI